MAIDYQATFSDTAADGIVAIGRNALCFNKGNVGNVAIGDNTFYSNGIGATTAFQAIANTGMGSNAFYRVCPTLIYTFHAMDYLWQAKDLFL